MSDKPALDNMWPENQRSINNIPNPLPIEEEELRNFLIEWHFNIKPGDNIDGELLIDKPAIKKWVDLFLERDSTKALITFIKAHSEQKALHARQELVYAIMRGEHGHDEQSIVKSIQQDIDHQLTKQEGTNNE